VYARLARRCATEPLVDELVDELSWDVPLRLFGGVHYLELAGIEPYALSGDWDDFRSALEARRDFLARFVREQAVQTNAVQRCFALLPAFLVLAAESGASTLDLVELGPSAGLNLLWDRYSYAYRAGRCAHRWARSSACRSSGSATRLLRAASPWTRRRGALWDSELAPPIAFELGASVPGFPIRSPAPPTRAAIPLAPGGSLSTSRWQGDRALRAPPEVALAVVRRLLAARKLLAPTPIWHTPVHTSRTLGERAGRRSAPQARAVPGHGLVQAPWRLRSVTSLSRSRARGNRGSAGNHARAVAYGAALAGTRSVVVTWSSASELKLGRARSVPRRSGWATRLEAFEEMYKVRDEARADPSVRRSARACRPGHARARAARRRPDLGTVVAPIGVGAHLRRGDRPAALPAGRAHRRRGAGGRRR
jgi:hypothetical protein